MRKFSALIIVLTLLFPGTTHAANIAVQDTVVGVTTDISATGLTPNASVNIVIEPPQSPAMVLPQQVPATGDLEAALAGSDLQRAGVYRIRIEDAVSNQTLAGPANLEVLPGQLSITRSGITTAKRTLLPNGTDEVTVSVTLQDQYGNPLEGRPVALISPRNEDRVYTLEEETNTYGTQEFSVSTTVPGDIVLRAMDLLTNQMLSTSLTLTAENPAPIGNASYYPSANQAYYPPANQQYYPVPQAQYYPAPQQAFYPSSNSYLGAQLVSFETIDGFELTAPTSANANEEIQKITLRAVDRNGRTVENYTGTVRFTSTDPLAILPNFGEYTFKNRDQGSKEFPLVVKFGTSGEQMILAEDINDPRISGDATILVQGGGTQVSGGNIEITSHVSGDTVGGESFTLTGKAPPLINVQVMGGLRDVITGTEQDGTFSVDVPLSQTKTEIEIRIIDEQNRFQSDPLTLFVDNAAPEVSNILFRPEQPQANEQTLISFVSEENLPKATFTIRDELTGETQEISLLENAASSGTYQGFFTAPSAGTYQPSITAEDLAGNATEVRQTLKVFPKSLPIVQNLQAKGQNTKVQLTWNAIDDQDIDGYRIYMGTKDGSEIDFPFTLDTGRPVTEATVGGLDPSTEYIFAVTALKGDLESREKSNVATASTLGTVLNITPQAASLFLEWEVPTTLPLSAFMLEFGVSPEDMQQKVELNGDMRAYTLRDLIDGVTYHVKLTPVVLTGGLLRDLAVTGQGTPNGNGFTVSQADEIPFDEAPILHGGAPLPPKTVESGIPPLAWWLAGAIAVGSYFMYVQRRRRMQRNAFVEQMRMQYK